MIIIIIIIISACGVMVTLDPYLIILSVKQGGIKYHFLSLW